MNQGVVLVVAAALVGGMIAAQGVINGRLAASLNGPLQAALISFSVGWLALAAVTLAMRQPFPVMSVAAQEPWWIWIGGLMGAVVVAFSAFAVPKIGVAAYVAAFIAGQLTAAIVYDHFGAFGQTVREATPLRLLGVVFMGVGVYLIRRF